MSTATDTPPTPVPPPRVSRRDRVYVELRELLMSGRVSPWERLAEEPLAERFGVSRTPVREALARLQADGLVEKRAHGLYLAVPSFEELTRLYELRVLLELHGIRRAIEDPTVRHDATRLDAELDVWRAMSGTPPEPDPTFVRTDERFHAVLLDTSGNTALTEALAGVNRRIRAVRMYDYLTADRMRATIDEHLEIGELVVSGRLPAALDALHAHVGASRDVVVERAGTALAMAHLGAASGEVAR
jgi:DNA-binding GntR family transcriptional regulator